MPVARWRFGLGARSYPTKQDQDQKNDNHKAKTAAAVVSGAIEWTATAPEAPETSEQDHNQNYEKYDANRQRMVSLIPVERLCGESCAFRRSSSSIRQ